MVNFSSRRLPTVLLLVLLDEVGGLAGVDAFFRGGKAIRIPTTPQIGEGDTLLSVQVKIEQGLSWGLGSRGWWTGRPWVRGQLTNSVHKGAA